MGDVSASPVFFCSIMSCYFLFLVDNNLIFVCSIFKVVTFLKGV